MARVMLHPTTNVLYFKISTLRTPCSLINMVVIYSSLMCFRLMFFRYFLNDFGLVQVAPIFTGLLLLFFNIITKTVIY